MKKISIIVPFYNSEKYLSRCIESLIQQTYLNIEIILIDNNSNDSSYEICKKYEQKDRRIKLLKEEKLGVACARNKGLKNAIGEYIGFVDSDDFVQKNFFEKLIKCFENSEIDFAISPIYIKNKDEQILNKEQCLECLLGNRGIAGFVWNKLFKRNIIEENNILFEENVHMCEDLLFCVKYVKYIRNTEIINENLYNYEKNESSITKSNFNLKRLSVLNAYELIIDELKEINSYKINSLASNNLIKHEIWIWSKLLFQNDVKEKKKYMSFIKKKIKDSDYTFIFFNKNSIKYKILFLIIKLF